MGKKVFDKIEDAVLDLKQGKFIIVVDDEGRENEGDLVALASKITPTMVNFMISAAKGLVCTPISENRANLLGLEPMVRVNQDRHNTKFTVSLDFVSVKTGISAYERAITIKELAAPQVSASQFKRPGHIFPLIGLDGGVLKRGGHTEAALDLAKYAANEEVAVICEIINEDGKMASLSELVEFAKQHSLKIIHINDLIHYRKTYDKLITREALTQLPSKFGTFELIGYRATHSGEEVIAICSPNFTSLTAPLVRLHSECLTGDALGSYRCDCGEQLAKSLEMIDQKGGYVIYLRQEGRGIGLINKLKAYQLQDQGMDTVEANLHLGYQDDLRDYYLASQVLKDLGVNEIKLISNNPRKIKAMQDYGINVIHRVELIMPANLVNQEYLKTKSTKLGHLF